MITELWNTLLIHPILNVLVLFYKGFLGIGIPGSLGFSIIALTVLVKIALHPLMVAQTQSMKKMADLKPHMDNIRERHKKDSARAQQEMAKLYKEHNINPAAGCLPLLIQFPFLIALYNVFIGLFQNGDPVAYINSIVYAPFMKIVSWDTHFFGLNLSTSPSHWQKEGIFLLAIPVVTALLQFIQTKMMTPQMAQQTKAIVVEGKDKKDNMSDFSNIMQKQMLYFFPIMLGGISYTFPLGLSLYWNTFTVFGIIQQRIINKAK